MSHPTIGTRILRWFSDSFGLRGSKNIASWGAAGALAYYFIYLPEQKRAQEVLAQREAAKRFAIEKGIQDMDRARPIPDPQDTGLIKGVKAGEQAQQSRTNSSNSNSNSNDTQ
eukprot:GHRR01005661.1.p1 GENE.GHRR01005661.1~~GHRR01005661.1.p1  ORF type:complete len:113 (+),score=41.05 GHRR01005661.1:107-445(+)